MNRGVDLSSSRVRRQVHVSSPPRQALEIPCWETLPLPYDCCGRNAMLDGTSIWNLYLKLRRSTSCIAQV